MTAKPAPCPMCKKPMVAEYRPFCSRRCADLDLARWFRGDYVIPGKDGEAEGLPDPDGANDRTE
jgi:uncharacterized protein